jgi:hypothetical protein
MRSVMRRTDAAVVWGVVLASCLSAASPAWSQVPAEGPGAAGWIVSSAACRYDRGKLCREVA